jgi:hypothetical protein
LAVVASLFNSDDSQNQNTFHVKTIFQPSIPDNQEYWKVFENDEHIASFLIDHDSTLSDDSEESQDSQKEIHDQSVVLSPKNYVSLESLFTRDDQTKILDPKEEPSIRKVQETHKINIGTPDSPKYINLGTSCTTEEIEQYTLVVQRISGHFSWSYDDLKEYEKYIFQHVIPLKEGSKPFNKKLRMINPKLKPLVKMELEKLKKRWYNFSNQTLKMDFKSCGSKKKEWRNCLCVDFRDLN